MKRLVFAAMILVLVSLSFAQQDQSNWLGTGRFDSWSARKDSTLETRIYVAGVDSFWTEAMLSWPYMGLDVIVGDTSTAVTDSVNFVVELWMWHSSRLAPYSNKLADKNNFCYVKDLTFNTTNRVNTSLSGITAVGAYQSIITGSAIPPNKYFRLRIRGVTGTKVLAGNYFEITPVAFRPN